MPTLTAYCEQLGWSRAAIAREAGVSYQVILKAENGEPITAISATRIAQALSRGLDKVIMARHIEGLNVREDS
jgi:transcriptional regulator with XRE-family HTH domain